MTIRFESSGGAARVSLHGAAVCTFAAVFSFSLLTITPALAQCPPEWSDQFAATDLNERVKAFVLFDEDDTGPLPPSVFVGGYFTTADGEPATRIARWRDNQWSRVGSGMDGPIDALVVFDEDGAGPIPAALFAGGSFTTASGQPISYLARWNGTSWTDVGGGVNGPVKALVVHDEDGPGPLPASLYVGGTFNIAGGSMFAFNIARWDGANWWPVGLGMNGTVEALAVFDPDGSGPGLPFLYAGGSFSLAGTAQALRVARWNGANWSSLGTGMGGQSFTSVYALTVFDPDGSGPTAASLIAGGVFTSAGGVSANYIARWNGTSWSGLGAGLDREVHTLAVYDPDGTGPTPPSLYAGGFFTQAGGQPASYISRWRSPNWFTVGGGMDSFVSGLGVIDADGAGGNPPLLYVGGFFTQAGSEPANHVAIWNGTAWSALNSNSPGNGTNNTVNVLATFDPDGSGPCGPRLYAGGFFTTAGGVPVNHVAQWTGDSWLQLGTGMNDVVYALATYDNDGAGPNPPRLYVGGQFTNAGGVTANRVAQWNGTNWSALGSGVNGTVEALVEFDEDGSGPNPPSLFVGGLFTTAGGNPAVGIARWNGSAWSPVGLGLNNAVFALAVADLDGPGGSPPALYAGGVFTTAGGVPANRIAKWDGAVWTPLGLGLNNYVFALQQYDSDGSGPNPPLLYAGGLFTQSGTASMNRVASWNGIAWSAVGGGVPQTGAEVDTLEVFDFDGDGPNQPVLCVGGYFTGVGSSGSVPANFVAQWNGSAWSTLNGGTDGLVATLKQFDEDGAGGNPPVLFVGGDLTIAGNVSSQNIASWGSPLPYVTVSPSDETVTAGTLVALSVGAGGATPLSYQWRRNGENLTDNCRFGGSSTSTLTILTHGPQDNGLYDVVITNACGTTTSVAATLTVNGCAATASGDLNADCVSDGTDIALFLDALYDASTDPGHVCAADFNGNGGLDAGDVGPFVQSLLGS